MKLIRLHIEGFGKLQNFEYRFDKGLNTLHYPNGWGKSTLAVFIKAMLYGLPATTKHSLDENERKKYTPWQGGAFGGSLEFETDTGRFRAERFFGAKEANDTFELYDLDTNLPSSAYSERLGEDLFGIDADGFERSTYLSQRTLKGGRDNPTIAAKLGNLLDDVGDMTSYDSAMEALDKRRKFYVMTGGRGAIAEIEQELLDKTAELERCRRVEDAMHAQEEELARLSSDLTAAQAAEAQTRARLEKAGLARERAALTEQKNRMLTELAELTAAQKQNDAFFCGIIPGDEEMQESIRLYEEIKKYRVKLETIPQEPLHGEELSRLHELFDSGIPTEAYFERMTQENETLRRIDARLENLKSSDVLDPSGERFAAGIPSKAQIDRAFDAIRLSADLQKKLDAADKTEPPRASVLPTVLGTIGLAIGVILAVLSFLPTLATLSLPLLIAGGVLGITGVVLLLVSRAKRRLVLDQSAQNRAQIEEWQAKQTDLLQGVQALLATYGMPSDDPARALAELSLLAGQYSEDQQKRDNAQRELEALVGRRAECVAYLTSRISVFLEVSPDTNDFAATLDRLQRSAERYELLRAQEEKRVSDRSETTRTLQALQNQLLVFLRRYDPSGRLRAGECLKTIGERLAEHRRLSREIAHRTSELRAFILEKKLDEASDAESIEQVDRLSEEAKELQARTGELHRRHATMKSAIDRLSLDADRVPDLEEQILRIKERLGEAKANADTIKNTAKLLEEAKVALSTRYLGGMQSSLDRHLSALAEVSPETVMDTSFEVHLREGGKTRSMESFSRGWRDMVEFCTRLSLTEALYEDAEKPFLLLDDPFVNLDDDRLPAAKRMLEALAEEYQILHLVCHADRT